MSKQDLVLDIDRITKHLIINDMFYGLFLSFLDKEESSKVELTGIKVDKSSMQCVLQVNPENWAKLSFEEKYHRLKHEALHLTNFHPLTADMYEKKKLDNIACDIEVNQFMDPKSIPNDAQTLDKFKQQHPQLNWKPKAGRDHYYKELMKIKDEDKDKAGNGISAADAHDWVIEDSEGNESDSLNEAEREALRVNMESNIEQIAEEMSKAQGNVPKEISDLIKGFIKPKPKYNYSKFIKNYIGNSTQFRIGSTKLRENQRFPDRPKVILKPLSKVAIYIDESGLNKNKSKISCLFESGCVY